MSDNYIPISQLPEFTGRTDGNETIIISRYQNGSNSDVVSYRMPIVSASPCLSDAMLPELSATLLSGFGDLSDLNKDQLEYRADGSHPFQLSSFSHKRIKDDIDTTDTNLTKFLSDEWYSVSAITQNNNHEITEVRYIDLHDVSAASHDDMVDYLHSLNLDAGIVITSLVEKIGIPLAQLSGKNELQTIYSGDPSKLVTIQPQTTVGNPIAEISFGGVSNRQTLYNGLSVNTVNPSYNTDGYVGETIAYINGVQLKNNVSLMSCCYGDKVIAKINGLELSNGVFLTDRTTDGNIIAVLNEKPIHNGIVISEETNVGRVICKIDGAAGVANGGQIYNNVNVDDNTDKSGSIIANINGKNVYNGVVIEDEPEHYLTYITVKKQDGTIDRHKMLAGIKLGSVTQNTTKGDLIAKIETTERTVPIYNGINTNELSGNIIAKLEAEIDALRAQHDADMQWIKNELKKYMLLNSGSATQTVVGPTTFMQKINGNITNADYAIKAQWS